MCVCVCVCVRVFACLCLCVFVFLVGCGVAKGGGLAGRLPLCWETEAGFFYGSPKSVPKEPRDYQTEIEPVG